MFKEMKLGMFILADSYDGLFLCCFSENSREAADQKTA